MRLVPARQRLLEGELKVVSDAPSMIVVLDAVTQAQAVLASHLDPSCGLPTPRPRCASCRRSSMRLPIQRCSQRVELRQAQRMERTGRAFTEVLSARRCSNSRCYMAREALRSGRPRWSARTMEGSNFANGVSLMNWARGFFRVCLP